MSLLLTFLVGLFILGGLILGFYSKKNEKIINLSIGVAFGVILSLMLLELVPEAYEKLALEPKWRGIVMLGVTAAIGILLMNILDGFVPHHEHESRHHHKHKDDTCHDEHLDHIGILATVALVLHNVIEGMTLYATSLSSMNSAYLLCVGIGLHNIPLGLLIAGTLRTKKEIGITGFCLVFSSFLGGILMSLLRPVINELIIGLFISLTLGMLIYIVFIELLGQMIHSEQKKINLLGIVLGVIIFLISGIMG